MRKLSALAILVGFVSLLILGGQAVAGPFHLNWGSEVNPAQCPSGGELVINVTFKVTNDVDTKVGGGVWAFDDYNKHIQVWQMEDGSFCADVRYVGKFTTIECVTPSVTPSSPQATEAATECGPQGIDSGLAGGINGNFEGGYMATITGTLNASPSSPTMGNIGTFDYGCQATDPGDRSTCSDLFDWAKEYFSSVSIFDQPWWGWIYHTPKNGTWVNVITGNLGNITD